MKQFGHLWRRDSSEVVKNNHVTANASERLILIHVCVWDFLNGKCKNIKLRKNINRDLLKLTMSREMAKKLADSWEMGENLANSWASPPWPSLKQNETHVWRMAWGRRIFQLLRFAKMFRPYVSVAVIFLLARIHMISGECPKVRIIKHEQVLFEILAVSS